MPCIAGKTYSLSGAGLLANSPQKRFRRKEDIAPLGRDWSLLLPPSNPLTFVVMCGGLLLPWYHSAAEMA